MPENIISRVKLPSNDIYKVRDKEARHFLNIEEVSGSSPILVTGGGVLENSKLSITVTAAQLQAIASAWSTFTDLAVEFRLQVVSEDGTVGESTFSTWIVANKSVLGTVALTAAQSVPTSGNYYIFTGTAETADTLKSYPFTLLLNSSTGAGVLDFTVSADANHTHGLINADGTIDSSSPITIPNLTSDPNKSYGILVNDTANDGLLSPSAITFGRDDRNAFLNKDGTWSSPSEGHFYVTGTNSVAAKTTSPYNAAQWKGSNSNITALYTGLSINYTLDVTGNATYGTVLDINELGAHPVVSHTGEPIGNTYAASAVIQLEYDATATADVYINSTEATTVTGCWKLALAQTPPYFVEGKNSIAAKTSKPYYAAIWHGTNSAIKALYSGLAISYKIDVTGNGTYGAVLDLNGWGEHPVVRNVNTAISNVYAVDSIVNLIYDAEQSASVYLGSGAVSVKGCWKIADYDTNTQIVYRLLQNYSHPYVDSNSGPLYRYELCFTTPNDTIIPISSVSNKPTVYTKEFTSIPFDPFRPIYYYATTTTVEPGDSITGSALYDVYLIDARYGFNINSAGTPGVTALEANKMVYLRAKYNTLTHSATFDQDLESANYLERSSLVQDLPSANPNTVAGNTLGPNEIYIYIFLGVASSEYAIDKAVTNFVYYWDTLNDCINVFYGDTEKEDKVNKVTSLSASSTDIQYPSAKAVYDALAGVAPTVIYTGTCSAVIGLQNQYATLADNKTGADIVADIDANKTVVLRITDSASDTYDFIYSGRDVITASGEEDQKEYYFVHISDGNEYIPVVVENTLVQICKTTKIEVTNNKVTSLSSSSTDTQYPSAKAVYDALANITSTVIYTGYASGDIGFDVLIPTLDNSKTANDIITDIDNGASVIIQISTPDDYCEFVYAGYEEINDRYDFICVQGNKYVLLTIHTSNYSTTISIGLWVNIEVTNNKVTSLSASSTDVQYPSAKAVYDELVDKENTSNKVTSLSASSTDTEYPSAKAVYDALAGVTPTVTYTGHCSYSMGSVVQSVALDDSKTYTDVIADIEADKNVILHIEDVDMDAYDFVYTGKQNLFSEPPLANEVSYSFTYSTTANNGYIKAIISDSIQVETWVYPEVTDNKVTFLSSSNTNTQYPSAKVVYDNLVDKLKYILVTPIGGAWDSAEGTYSCTISAADYTKVNNAWSTDDFCVKTTINFPGANSTNIPVSFTLFKALTTTFENVEYYVFNAHYTGSTELDLEFADYDSFIFCISKAGAAGAAHSCLGFVHQGTTETDVINIINTRLANYVDLTTNQTVGGTKTFTSRPLSAEVYTRIAYLQSDYNGSTVTSFAYIDSGVKRGVDWTNKLTIVLDGYFTVSQTKGFCGYDSGGQIGQGSGKWSTEAGVSTVNCVGIENRATVTQVMDITQAKDTLYINDTQIAQRTISTASSYATQYNYPIFVAASSGGPNYSPAALVLYSFKMYDDNDVLIRDFIPVRTSLGTLGLLDLVNNEFHLKQGQGSFTAGADSTTVTVSAPLLTAGDVAPVALSNDYNDLINKPTIPSTGRLNTNNSTALTPNSSEAFTSNIALHKIAKTGTYADLLNKPSDGSATIASVANDIVTLKAGVTQSTLTISNSSGDDITLAKVAKTGAYSDLSGTPTIPSAPGTLNTTATTSQPAVASEALSGNIILHKVSKTGDYDDLLNKPTIDNRVIIKCILDSTAWLAFVTSWTLADSAIEPFDFTVSSHYVAGFEASYRTKLLDIYQNKKEGVIQVYSPTESSYFEYILNAMRPGNSNTLIFWGNSVTIAHSSSWYPVRFTIEIRLDISDNDPPEDMVGTSVEVPGGIISSSNITGLAMVATSGDYTDLTNTPSLATVATSGDYEDLLNTPSIPTTPADIGAADENHNHGNIGNDGTLGNAPITIINGDSLVITDSSGAIAVSDTTFDGTTTNQFLSKKGTWESPPTITIDSALSTTSENPVQNKVIDAALKTKVDLTSNQTIGGEKTFTERPRVSLEVTLPSGYTQLDYIKGDGTAYINTGKKYNTSNTVFLDFRQVNTSNYRIWGTFGQQSYVGPNVSMTYSNGWMVCQETVANQQRGVGLPAIDTKRHSVWIQSNGHIIFDGTDYGVSAGWAANYQFNFNAYLFTINPGGTTPTTTFNGEIYHYRVWDNNGALIQDMYPVRYTSGSTTTYGMYDIIENTYYPNANSSGAFTPGSADILNSTILVESDLAPVALSGSYNDLTNKPTIPTVGVLNTNNPDAQSVSSSESFGSTIKLHKVSKTGSFGDLLNRPNVTVSNLAASKTITSLTQTNGTIAATAADIAITSTQVSSGVTITATSGDSLAIFDADDNKLKSGLTFNATHGDQYLRKDGTWASTPATTVGALSISSTGQSIPSSAESFTENITLHNVAKTGSFSDLLNKPSAAISGLGTNKTITVLSQSDGTISASASNIAITSDQVTANSTAETIATGDALIIADSSNNYKLAKTSITFDVNQQKSKNFLCENGTWVDVNTVIPAPMQFKGTVGGSHGTYSWATLPSASSENTGWTLKVLEAHTGIPTCKVGDTIISDGSIWVVIPSGDEPSGTVTSVALSEGSGITITGGPITTSGVITVAHRNTSDVADTTNTGRTYIQNIDFDEFGHVLGTTSATETVVIPSNNITGSGTSGYIAKFDGNNTITNGPALGSDTTTFLRNDGTWATPTDTNDKVKQIGVPSFPEPAAYGGYNILLAYGNEPSNTDETNFTRKSAMVYDPTSKALTTGGTINGYSLNAAAAKAVDTSISAASTSTNLPTSQAVASFVEGKGYVTTNTTYTFVGGTNQFTVTPSGGSAQVVTITPSIPIDTVVSDSSTNAVQNSAIYAALPKVMRFI